MTIKSALSVIALAAGLVATPAIAQTTMMIGTQTVAEADVEAVKARCLDLKTAADTQSLVTTSEGEEADTDADTDADADAELDADAEVDAGEVAVDAETETTLETDASIANAPATDAETATSVDLDIITLEECEAGGWLEM